MKKLLLFAATLMLIYSAAFSQVLYEDDFESYNVGDYMAVVNPDWWTTWDNMPGSATDAQISDEQAYSGTQSVKVDGTTDLVLKMGNKTVGKYRFSFYYYIPSGYGGYFNIQHFETPGIEWAYEVYFGATGSAYLNAGANQVTGFNYTHDTWMYVENIIDLDNDWTQLYVDGNLIYEWPFSYQASTTTGTLQLGGADIFAGAPTGETPLFYFDDLTFENIPSALFSDDFESYSVGDYIAVENPDWFTTWSGMPGSTEDAMISDEQALSGAQSVKVDGVTDLVFKMGDKTSGKYDYSFYYYIPTGYGGYYNIQHFENPGIEYAYQVYFATDGSGSLDAGVESAATFTYPHDTWFYVENIIDLNNDSTHLYIDGNLVYEWPFSYQTFSTTGTLQLGGCDLFAGAPTGEDPTYYFDDMELVQLEPGAGAASINLDPVTFTESLNAGSMSTDYLNISNTGDVDLDYSIVVTYPEPSKKAAVTGSTGGTKHVVLSTAQSPNAVPGGAPEPSDDVILNYDGDNFSAIGLTDGGPMRVSAKFPSSMVHDYIGMELTSIEVYINDLPIETKAQVYDYGLTSIPGPGEMLLEQSFTSPATSWYTINLSTPVWISGGDIWVGYWVDHNAGTFPAGTDAGPHDPNGDWISTGPGWSHLSDNATLDYNWNIRAHLTGDAIVQWLSVTPASGTVGVGENQDIELDFDATGLEPGTVYHAQLVVNNNDPANPQAMVPVTLAVLTGIDEVSNSAVMIYPNPTSDKINIKSDVNIMSVDFYNLTGQVISHLDVNGKDFSTSIAQFGTGVYMMKVKTETGVVTHKISVK